MSSAKQLAMVRARLGYKTREDFIRAFVPVTSRAGLFIRTRATKTVGTPVRFEFRLADDSRVFVGEGVVRKEVPFDAENPSRPCGMLVALRRLDRASKAVFDAILALKEGAAAPAPVPEPSTPASPVSAADVSASTPVPAPAPEPEPEPEPRAQVQLFATPDEEEDEVGAVSDPFTKAVHDEPEPSPQENLLFGGEAGLDDELDDIFAGMTGGGFDVFGGPEIEGPGDPFGSDSSDSGGGGLIDPSAVDFSDEDFEESDLFVTGVDEPEPPPPPAQEEDDEDDILFAEPDIVAAPTDTIPAEPVPDDEDDLIFAEPEIQDDPTERTITASINTIARITHAEAEGTASEVDLPPPPDIPPPVAHVHHDSGQLDTLLENLQNDEPITTEEDAHNLMPSILSEPRIDVDALSRKLEMEKQEAESDTLDLAALAGSRQPQAEPDPPKAPEPQPQPVGSLAPGAPNPLDKVHIPDEGLPPPPKAAVFEDEPLPEKKKKKRRWFFGK